ncbi:MAG: DUF4058 family protein [Chloroflexi bacterium]|nr:DUF4058 family protein [Chloroflexota bacterium]
MPAPLPGMDPWLEHPALWPDVHQRLITSLAEYLGPILRPRYYVAVETRTYIAASDRFRYPDVMVVTTPIRETLTAAPPETAAGPFVVNVPVPDEIEEGYLEVREVASGEVITVVEILSPTNKQPGEGRKTYETKRAEILRTRTHLVEIDLLRDWPAMPFFGDGHQTHYRILIRRGERYNRADLYAFNVRDPFPRFPLPLQKGDAEPIVDLKPLLDTLYDKASYDLRVDYTKPPTPPLADADLEWAAEVLRRRAAPAA